MRGRLILEDGTELVGKSFGHPISIAGEVVFSTGMVGYPESLTDPSYAGQILVFTYPLIGNYGVPNQDFWESDRIQVAGLIVSTYINTPSHITSVRTLASWLKEEKIPALEIKDTRLIAKMLREQGTMLGKIVIGEDIGLSDPNKENLVERVSTKKVKEEGTGNRTIVLFDCGAKKNIKRSLLARNVKVITVPWNYNPFYRNGNSPQIKEVDAIVVSNGPGDPKLAQSTIEILKKALAARIPILGICLGNQLLALAAGGDTYKLKFGHRGQNQPCLLTTSQRCFLTTQNHGFAVGQIPSGFKPWFINANDNTNEGITHNKYPWMSVQFHPEASPGPTDTDWIFDFFLDVIFKKRSTYLFTNTI